MATKTTKTTKKATGSKAGPVTSGPTCKVQGCSDPVYALGLCISHWATK